MTRDRATRQAPEAIVWIDGRHAIVASAAADGGVATRWVDRGAESETEFLAHVVHQIGDRPTVSIVGPSGVRLALEREFVAISHRPERLIGIPMAAHKAEAQILERMRRLAA
jgi:hypothetical protein